MMVVHKCIFLSYRTVWTLAVRVIMINDIMRSNIRAEIVKKGIVRTEIESTGFLKGISSYVTYCVYGGRVLTLEFLLIFVVAALAGR